MELNLLYLPDINSPLVEKALSTGAGIHKISQVTGNRDQPQVHT